LDYEALKNKGRIFEFILFLSIKNRSDFRIWWYE
jgi:hypothetical protein